MEEKSTANQVTTGSTALLLQLVLTTLDTLTLWYGWNVIVIKLFTTLPGLNFWQVMGLAFFFNYLILKTGDLMRKKPLTNADWATLLISPAWALLWLWVIHFVI